MEVSCINMLKVLDTHTAGPHEAGVGYSLLLVECEHLQQLGIIRPGLMILASEAAHRPHGRDRLLCHFVGLSQ